MRTIYKYEARLTDVFTLDLPRGAKVLSVQAQNGVAQMWAMVDPKAATEKRDFMVVGTGHPIADSEVQHMHFVDTFQMKGGALVFHLFEYTQRRSSPVSSPERKKP